MKLLRDESGQTLVMVAVSLTVLLGFAAFATDIGIVLHEKRLAQSATDSAAIAAALATNRGNDATAAGKADAALNGFTDQATDSNGNTVTTVTISVPPVDGIFTGKAGYVEATISQQAPTFFMRMFGTSAMTINSRAVATYLGNASACLYVLNPQNLKVAASPWGNSSIFALNCGFLINGSMTLGASDSIQAGYVGTTGTISNPGDITGTVAQNIAGFSDPLARLSGSADLPTVSGTTCTSPSNPPIPPATTGTPGPICHLNVPLSGVVSGVYMYTIPADATYSGNVTTGSAGVTVVLTNGSLLSASGGGGKGNATLSLNAPSDNSVYNGIVIDAPTYTGQLNLDFGSTVAIFNGTVYAPNADLSLQDQGGSNKGPCGAGVTVNGDLVVGTLDVADKNKGNLCINSSSTGGNSPIPRIALVE